MNISVDNLSPCKKLVRVDVPEDEVRRSLDRVVVSYQKKARLPGFRPGKAPKIMVRSAYGDSVREEAQSEMVQQALDKVRGDMNLRIVGRVDLEIIHFSENSSFQFVLKLETEPDFEMPDYKGLQVKHRNFRVTPEEVDEHLALIARSLADPWPVERSAEATDAVRIEIRGTCGGRPLGEFSPKAGELASGKKLVAVDHDNFLPGFSAQLLGCRKGEDRRVSIRSSGSFHIPELRGKQLDFDVRVLEVCQIVVPRVDDGLARSVGERSLARLRLQVEGELQAEVDRTFRDEMRSSLLETLVSRVRCDFPDALLEEDTMTNVHRIIEHQRDKGIPEKDIEARREEIFHHARESAKRTIMAGFVIDRIAGAEGLHPTDEEVSDLLDRMRRRSEKEEERIDPGDLTEEHARYHMVRDKVLDFLEMHAEIEEIFMSNRKFDIRNQEA